MAKVSKVDKEIYRMYYEDLVMNRIQMLFHAKDTGNADFFDELVDEIEMLFKLVPDLYSSYKEQKEKLDESLGLLLSKVDQEIDSVNDEILRKVYKAQKQEALFWDYRNDTLELILNAFNNYGMLPYLVVERKGEIMPEESTELVELEPIQEAEAVEEKSEEQKKVKPPKEEEKVPEIKPEQKTNINKTVSPPKTKKLKL